MNINLNIELFSKKAIIAAIEKLPNEINITSIETTETEVILEIDKIPPNINENDFKDKLYRDIIEFKNRFFILEETKDIRETIINAVFK